VLDIMEKISSQQYHESIFGLLKQCDRQVYDFIAAEYQRLQCTLQLIAAENQCSQAVLAALGSVIQNKTTEGFPGARYHGGCEIVDSIERLASARAKEAFSARYANVQPHSGTSANQIVITAMLGSGDKILSLSLDQGGHVSHGAKVSICGKFFDVYNYSVDKDTYLLDYDAISAQAKQVKPKMIICGATAYARIIDFKKFREIADSVGAYLMADVSHIAGLIMGGVHPSPVDYAHFTTTSTYKPGGPRGGLIVMGKDYDRTVNIDGKDIPLWQQIERTTFPGVQGTPYLNNIAAKAVFFKEALGDEYKKRQFKIVENAGRLADDLADLGYDVVTGGTDNHMVLINVSHLRQGLTGFIAQKSLEDCGIIINMNRLPFDKKGMAVTSGARLGTPVVTKNKMGPDQMDEIAVLVDAVLRGVRVVSDRQYDLDAVLAKQVSETVRQLCEKFPLQ
jgi:glycine hydroxymethyltransferase